MNGIEATKKIREIENVKNKHTPIIALTAYSLPEELDKCIQEGMDDVITKPINVKIIMKKLAELNQKMPVSVDESIRKNEVKIKEVMLYRHFNKNELIKQQCHDKEFLIELIEMFFYVLPEYMNNIKEAIAEENADHLKKAAHTLKGTLKTLWVTQCDQLALELEMKGKENNLSHSIQIFKNLEQHIVLLKEELHHFLEHIKSGEESI